MKRYLFLKKALGKNQVTDEKKKRLHFSPLFKQMAAKKLFDRVCVQLCSYGYTPSLKQQSSAALKLFGQPQIGAY